MLGSTPLRSSRIALDHIALDYIALDYKVSYHDGSIVMTRRILIIDDDPFIRDVTQVTLSKVAGWSATTAGSGLEGLEQAKQGDLDAILLDVSMPGMDGFSVFEQLQADPETRSIPVILLTAKSIPADTTPLLKMGLAGVIVKPFDPLAVCHQIAELLSWEAG